MHRCTSTHPHTRVHTNSLSYRDVDCLFGKEEGGQERLFLYGTQFLCVSLRILLLFCNLTLACKALRLLSLLTTLCPPLPTLVHSFLLPLLTLMPLPQFFSRTPGSRGNCVMLKIARSLLYPGHRVAMLSSPCQSPQSFHLIFHDGP